MALSPRRHIALRFFGGLLLGLTLSFSFFATQIQPTYAQTPAERFENEVKPRLSIPGLDLNFADVTVTTTTENGVETRRLDIPYLSQYIGTIYKYAVGVSGILAVIMMMVGGMEYLIARDTGMSKKGRQRITNALVGLGLTLFAFIILRTVNPDLVQLDALQITEVKRSEFDEFNLHSTLVETGDEDDQADFGPLADEPGDVPSTSTVGSYSPSTICPITLVQPVGTFAASGPKGPGNDLRSQEFLQKMPAVLAGLTAQNKILKTADAAAACGVKFGCCGCSVGRIYATTGLIENACFTQSACNYESGNFLKEKGKLFAISEAQKQKLYTFHCNDGIDDKTGQATNEGFAGCTTSCPKCLAKCDSNKDPVKCKTACTSFFDTPYGSCAAKCTAAFNAPGCAQTGKEATRIAYDYLVSTIPGFPNAWTDALKPGDSVYIYNGNGSNLAAHSFIFQGWEDAGKGIAQVVESKGAGKFVTHGTVCLKRSSCPNGTAKPLLYIFRLW